MGLDLIDGVPDELWTEVRDIVQETGIKTIPMEKKCKKKKNKTKQKETSDTINHYNHMEGKFPVMGDI